MKLNISRNTVIASDLVGQVIISTLKEKHQNVYILDVDLLESYNQDDLNSDHPDLFLKSMVHTFFKCYGSRSLCEELLDSIFVVLSKGIPDWSFRYIVFRLKNWEPYYLKFPDGFLESFALLSYWAEGMYQKQIRDYSMGSSKDWEYFFGNGYFRVLDRWYGNHFVILSLTKPTLPCL